MRKSQYSLILFVGVIITLFTMSGIISNLTTQKADQIKKAQTISSLNAYVRNVRNIINSERQAVIDFADIHLGLLGGWPKGVSPCGAIYNDSSFLKNIPYWYISSSVSLEYSPQVVWERGSYKMFVVYLPPGKYQISIKDNFILDNKIISSQEFNVAGGNHTFIFDTKNLCNHLLKNCNIKSSTLPKTFTIKRVVSEDCFPKESFIREVYFYVINNIFKTMDKNAYEQIAKLSDDFQIKNFALINYAADIKDISKNYAKVVFSPINVPYLYVYKITKDVMLSHVEPIFPTSIFNSDFLSFLDIGEELIKNDDLSNEINKLLSHHLGFISYVYINRTGSTNKQFNEYMRKKGYNWNLDIDYSLEIPKDERPFCVYLLKEVCQFMTDEVPDGYKSPYYIGSHELFDDFTSNYLSSNCRSSCQECHDVGKAFNPCYNITYDPCKDCFNCMTGLDYDSATNKDCEEKVNEIVLPLLKNYVPFRLSTLDEALSKKYKVSFKVIPNQINITKIDSPKLIEVMKYNDSCSSCEAAIPQGDCIFLESDISVVNANISSEGKFANAGDFLDSTGINEFVLNITLKNVGNTKEIFYIRGLVDANNNMKSHPYIDGDTNYDLDNPSNYDVEAYKSSIFLFPGEEKTISLGDFVPANYLGRGTHFLKVCAYNKYGDEWDLSNNCVHFYFGICSDGDLAKNCCESYDGVWANNKCCGDDAGVCRALIFRTSRPSEVNSIPLINKNTQTISFWIKPTSGSQKIFSKGSYLLYTSNYFLNLYSVGQFGSITPPVKLNKDEWNHVVISISKERTYFYVNGKKYSYPRVDLTGKLIVYSNVYDFMLFNRVLSDEEANSLERDVNCPTQDNFFINEKSVCYYGVAYRCPEDAPISVKINGEYYSCISKT